MRDTTVNNIFISDGEGYLGNQEYNFTCTTFGGAILFFVLLAVHFPY